MLSIINAHLPVLAIVIFLVITFGISVIEKCTDWKGTINYITSIFKDTFIKNLIKPLVFLLLLLEVVTCVFLIYGGSQLVTNGFTNSVLWGFMFSAVCILYMLIGQRIAKDYVGATSLTVYFILTVFGIHLLV